MNERFKELAEQAGANLIPSQTNSQWVYFKEKWETSNVDLEKFAELIVRECATVCLTATEKESSVHLVSVAYADAVKKHFGVE